MYHSINIIAESSEVNNTLTMNTYKYFGLVPTQLPVISSPSIKTKKVDIPGANGVLDLTEALTPYPTYGNRTGSLEFAFIPDRYNRYITEVDETNFGGAWRQMAILDHPNAWAYHQSRLMNRIHGRLCKLILEDDPNWYYHGRIALNQWKPSTDGKWPLVTINYDLEPYKLSVKTLDEWSTADWEWDSFNFDAGTRVDSSIYGRQTIDGEIYEGYYEDPTSNTTILKNISVDADGWVPYRIQPFTPGSSSIHPGLVSSGLTGMMPISPVFKFSSSNMGVKLENAELRYSPIIIEAEQSGEYSDPSLIFYDYFINGFDLYFKGHGTVTVKFRAGSL